MDYSKRYYSYNETMPSISPALGLPPLIRDAVLEVERNIQAPLDLVIASALGAVSLACQNQITVQSGSNNLISPCNLFFLTIAASGDRKSTVDRHFTEPIIEFEKEKRFEYCEQMIVHNVTMDNWNDIRKDFRSRTRKAIREGAGYEELEKLEHLLIMHDKKKPAPPKTIKLIYTDATPESIVYGLHRDWPSAVILSDEAGSILNGRAMNDLGMLNQIWDGSSLSVDRKSSESFTLSNARLTISLMTQEKSLRKFIERNDGMARDIGFLARCLVSNPYSIQGNRAIKSSSNQNIVTFEKLENFKKRISFILNKNLNSSQNSTVLKLSPEADNLWVNYFNEIEIELKPQGKLVSIKDAASKIADNALRMAAIFHFFENRPEDISEKSMSEAISTCNSYLKNFLKLFGKYGLYSAERQDVDKLVGWLRLKNGKRKDAIQFKKNNIRQNGPIRNSHQLDKALEYLRNEGAVKFVNEQDTEWIDLILGNIFFSADIS